MGGDVGEDGHGLNCGTAGGKGLGISGPMNFTFNSSSLLVVTGVPEGYLPGIGLRTLKWESAVRYHRVLACRRP
jgi:hypothetical protein